MTLTHNSVKTALALVGADNSHTATYGDIDGLVEIDRQMLRQLARPAMAFQFAPNSISAIAAYLACLAERLPLGLGEPSLAARTRVIDAYAPTAVILPLSELPPTQYELVGLMAGGELNLWQNADGVYNVSPHKELALLLPTSGSTGDAKMVRLSYANIETNARSIAKYLDIKPGEVAIQSLPMHYSYGLSVLNSHLISGAAVAITSYSFMRPEFWRVFDEYGCTSFAGVPYMYETLHRLRMNPADRPTLRTLTQAGGHLKIDHVKHFNDLAASKGAKLFVMYGQTEATARISYVPAERLVEKLGSIGVAIPGGKLWVEPVEGDATARQLFYSGPNVMLGYASEPADLARGDEQKGVLATGDLAECDTDGYFRITGRLARFAKLFGKRINLASVEIEVEQHFGVRVAALDGGDKLRIFVEADTGEATGKIKAHLAALLGVPPLAIQPAHIDKLPLTASGKKDYKALR